MDIWILIMCDLPSLNEQLTAPSVFNPFNLLHDNTLIHYIFLNLYTY